MYLCTFLPLYFSTFFFFFQRTGLTDKVPLGKPQKTSSPLTSVSLLALQFYHCSIGFPNVWLAIFCKLGDDSSFFALIQQQWRACVCRMLLCKLACTIATLLIEGVDELTLATKGQSARPELGVRNRTMSPLLHIMITMFCSRRTDAFRHTDDFAARGNSWLPKWTS